MLISCSCNKTDKYNIKKVLNEYLRIIMNFYTYDRNYIECKEFVFRKNKINYIVTHKISERSNKRF